MRNRFQIIAMLCLGLTLLHWMHQKADQHRFSELQEEERFFLPNPQATKAMALGQQTMVSDLLWIRTILIFADFAWDCQEREARWLESMLRTMSTLDSKWRTIYFYGGTMLGVCSKVDAADEIYRLGHENLPDDPFFPFSLAMNAFTEHRDYVSAEYWLRIAAEKPTAPSWYKAAVAGVINEQGQREASIQYLQEELKTPLDPSVRSATEERLRLLLHEKYAEQWQLRKETYERSVGEPLWDFQKLLSAEEVENPEALLENWLDPWGEGWLIAADGQVRSFEMERRQAKKTREAERHQLKPPNNKRLQ